MAGFRRESFRAVGASGAWREFEISGVFKALRRSPKVMMHTFFRGSQGVWGFLGI